MTRIYLDVCCLKRPFDDQGQARVRREASAVARIMTRTEAGEHELCRSPALRLENSRNPREDGRLVTDLWLDAASVEIPFSREAMQRARELQGLGFGVMDALHVAFAEAGEARWLVSCDDRLLRLAERHADRLRVEVVSPLDFQEGDRG